MGAIPGAGDGMRADTAGISGRGAGNDGRAVVPAGVPVRVRGHGGRDIRAGTGGERDHGRGEAFGDWVRALPEGRGRVWHGDEGWRHGAGAPRRRRGDGVVFGWGGFGTDKRLDRGGGGGAGGGDGGVGCGKVRVAEGGHAATAAPGADPAGDELSTGGETGGGRDAMFGAGRQVPAGGGRDGRGQTSSGPAARCETGLRGD